MKHVGIHKRPPPTCCICSAVAEFRIGYNDPNNAPTPESNYYYTDVKWSCAIHIVMATALMLKEQGVDTELPTTAPTSDPSMET